MGLAFNADEIYEMAEEIERNGAQFYRTSAEAVGNSSEKEFLLELARMEDEHEVTFAELRKDLTDKEKASPTFDPDGDAPLYLKALADTRVFFEKEINTSSMEAILKDAILAEKDSIVFYLGMKELVPTKMGKEKIDHIVKEEMSHIRLLSNKLVAIKK